MELILADGRVLGLKLADSFKSSGLRPACKVDLRASESQVLNRRAANTLTRRSDTPLDLVLCFEGGLAQIHSLAPCYDNGFVCQIWKLGEGVPVSRCPSCRHDVEPERIRNVEVGIFNKKKSLYLFS